MKFRKHLSVSVQRIFPNWVDKFLSYKLLKKQLKKIYPSQNLLPRPEAEVHVIHLAVEQEVNYFMVMLDAEMDKFNEFFLDKEQDYVIKMKILQERVAEVNGTLELFEVGRQIVEFHGEMVLLENYSALNYIVKECERMVDQLFSSNPRAAPSALGNDDPDNEGAGGPGERLHIVPEELEEIRNMENTYLRHTLSALRVLNDIRSRSYTVSETSLPPMPGEVVRDILGDPPSIDQTA